MEDIFHEMDLISRQLNQAHHAAVQWELNAAGLREVGHPMLLTILESGDERPQQCSAQRELAELLHISPAAVANSLKSLERSGYIRREPGQRDARRNRVILTEKGAQAVTGCRNAFQRVSDRMMSGFTLEELEQLAQFQQRMLNNLLAAYPRPEGRRERRERPDWRDRPGWDPRPQRPEDRRGRPEDRCPPFTPNRKEET